MAFNREMYDALEAKQINFLVGYMNKEIEDEYNRKMFIDIIRVVSDHYLFKRQTIDYINDLESKYTPRNYDEM